LQALTPFGTDSIGIRLDVQAVEPTSGTIEITYLTPDAVAARATTLNLDSETAQIDIDRSITLRALRGGCLARCRGAVFHRHPEPSPFPLLLARPGAHQPSDAGTLRAQRPGHGGHGGR
jgi:hypothetical protein